jgi:hypothetical protein
MPSAVPVSPEEFVLLTRACEQLPVTNVQDEEKHVADNPVLTLMSTVLSLNRRWYSHALPARRYFEANLYNDLKPPTLAKFASLLDRISLNKSDWSSAAKQLWDRNEWDKCRMLSELTEYFVVWKGQNFPDHSDREATTRLRPSGQLRNGLEFRPPNLMRESGMSCSLRAQRTRDGPAGSDSRRQQSAVLVRRDSEFALLRDLEKTDADFGGALWRDAGASREPLGRPSTGAAAG